VSLLSTAASPALADPETAALSNAPTAPVIVQVVSVTSLVTSNLVQSKECTPVLLTQREFELAQAKSQPWLMRNIKGVTGAPLGAAAGAYLAMHYLSARIWILPAALVGGAAGWFVGPFGILLGAGGSVLGHALTHKTPITMAGGVVGGLIGMALWHFVVPPPKPVTPDSLVEVPVQHFVTNEQCDEVQHRRILDGELYKVDFVLEGRPMSANLSYDPGNTLSVYPDGRPVLTSPKGTEGAQATNADR
jgi:hypothetical protein